MKNALCPSCKERPVEIVERRVGDSGGVVVSYFCPECDNTWEITF